MTSPVPAGLVDTDKLSTNVIKVFSVVACALFAVAVVEWALRVGGVNLPIKYVPGRLVEFAAMFLVPVITAFLWQIRQELGKRRKPPREAAKTELSQSWGRRREGRFGGPLSFVDVVVECPR